MKNIFILLLLALCSAAFGQTYHVEVSPWTGTNDPVQARIGLGIGTNDMAGGNATDGMVLTRTGAKSQWELGTGGGSITNVFIFTNIVVLNTNTTVTNIFYFTNIVDGLGGIPNVWTTNQWAESYLDTNGDLWTANVTTDGAHLQTWYMGNGSVGGASENVPRIFDGGGQSDGNWIGGQYSQIYDSGYNFGCVSFSGPSYQIGLSNCVGNLTANYSTPSFYSSWNALIGADNYNTNDTYSFSGGYFNTAVCDTAYGLEGFGNTMGTSGFGWYAGQGNFWFNLINSTAVGKGNTVEYSANGTYNGVTNYVIGDNGGSIHTMWSFCVSNSYCSANGVYLFLTNNFASSFSGFYITSSNANSCVVTGGTNFISGALSYSVVGGNNNTLLNTNVSIYVVGLSNVVAGNCGNDYINGEQNYLTNCHGVTINGKGWYLTNCNFCAFSGVGTIINNAMGLAYGFNPVINGTNSTHWEIVPSNTGVLTTYLAP